MDEGFAVEAVKPAGVEFGYFYARLYCHSVGPLDEMKMLAVGRSIISKRCMRLPGGRQDFTGFMGRFQGSGAQWLHSKVSNCLRISAKAGSLSRTILGEALLNGSSAGMRSSQRVSASFLWAEKWRRTKSCTSPGLSVSACGASLALVCCVCFAFAFH